MEKIFGVIIAMYLIIEALVPKIAGWQTALSSVGGSDWGWVVFLIFLAIMYFIVKEIIKSKK
jgi:hypothetical protein